MTTVEKRRSSRKSHRKRIEGGYSDTETDREVSSLTDRAFRSLCIGDEAVYNDSDLSASPCSQRDRQLALSHNVQEREDRERLDLKRTAHESFSLRVQQYGHDWNYRGMCGAAIHKDQQWGVCGEGGPQGRLSATLQQSFVEAPQQEYPSRELSQYSNGTAEVGGQPHRSRSRVSSLVQSFNSEGQQDEAVYNNETSWDKSALMSIERELSEFSSYPQNMNTGYFPSAGIFSSQNYYSSDMASISQMNPPSSFMRSSHMSTQDNCNSNFFIHSEFSPFRVWRDQNRFPFHRGQVSGFVPCSEFQKWYETPMYKELSLQPQQHPSMFSDQAYHRNTFAPAFPMTPQRSTSASSMMQRASAVEKRCESTGQYRKRAQSTGANRLTPQRPSTASPSSEMSRQVRDTISSVRSLQQKIKMMAEQNIETHSQGGFYNSNYLNPYGPTVPNMVSSNPYTAPYQMQKSPVYAPQEPQQFMQPHSVSPQPVEHAPVRAESRGATPEIKMSSYKSRAASLLYNLKDNRKRVKATYSPSKFNAQEKYKQEPKDFVIDVPEFQENELLNSTDEGVGQYGYQALSPGIMHNSRSSEIQNHIDRNGLNVPQYGYQVHSSGMIHPQQYPQSQFVNPAEKSISLNVPQYGYQTRSPGILQNAQFVNPTEDRGNRLDPGPYGYQAHNPGMLQQTQFPQNSQNMQNSQQLYPGQNYRAPHPGFTGYTPEYYANNKLANGQNPYENISSFAPYKQGVSDSGEGNYVNRLGQNAAAEMQRFGVVGQSRDYVSKDNSKQQFNEAASGEFTGVDRYNQLKENKYDYNNVYSQDMWGQTNSQEIQRPGIPLAQNYQNINAYQRANTQDNVQSYNYEQKLIDAVRPLGTVTSAVSYQGQQYPPPHPAPVGNPGYAQHNTQQPGAYRDVYAPPTSHEYNTDSKMKENYAPQDYHKYYDQESKKQTIISSQGGAPIATEELGQRKETAIKENGIKGTQLNETRRFENSKQEENIEQVEEMLTRDQGINGKVSLQQNELNETDTAKEMPKVNPHHHKEVFEEDTFAKYRSVQDKDSPTAEEQIKQRREEESELEVTDEQEHEVETELQPVEQHANAEELKEEAINPELAESSKEARIEQVKPEPGRKERVITDQANETQARDEDVERKTGEERQGEERSEANPVITEQIMENDTNRESEEKEEKEVIAIKDETSIIEIQNATQEKNHEEVIDVKVINEQSVSEEKAKNTEMAKDDATNVNNMQSLSQSEPEQPVICKPDKVEQAKTELAETETELAMIEEKMKGEPKDQKDEEHTGQINDNSIILSKESPVLYKGLDHADRGADDYEHIREKYNYNQAADTNKTSITDKVIETLPNNDKKDEIIQNTVDSNLEKENTNSEVVSDTTDSNEKAANTEYDEPTESQYVYSESSKDFKLTVANNDTDHEDTKGVKQDAPIENEDKSDDSQQRENAKQVLVEECKLPKSDLLNSTDMETAVDNDASKVRDVPVEKIDKDDTSQHKHAKQAVVERKQKSSDHNTSKETSVKGLTLKDKAHTKHQILTSKIKAHAEKEISAIKEGFAKRDEFKNPTKPLALSQNMSIRQKPPSQEVHKKQEKALNSDINEVQPPLVVKTVTDSGQELPQKPLQTAAVNATSKTKSVKSTEKPSIQKDTKVRVSSPTKTEKPKQQDDPLKQDNLDKEDNADLANPANMAPSLQLGFGQNESAAQDYSLNIMGIMVTVKERNHLENNGEENQDIQELLSAKSHNTETNIEAESTISRFSEKATVSQVSHVSHDYNETKNMRSETDSMTALESTEKNFIDCATEKTLHPESTPPQRPQSETQLLDHLAEKVMPLTLTVPAKNKVLAATQPVSNKQDIIEETKECANSAPDVATGVKDQGESPGARTEQDLQPTIEMKRVMPVPSIQNNEETQLDDLHIDSIAIRVVPAVHEDVITTGSISSGSVMEKETKEISSISSNHPQESSPTDDDVQKVLSSVRKQAQLLKSSNQQKNETENDQIKAVDSTLDETTKPLFEEGYFQVENRNNETQDNNISVGQAPKAISQEREHSKSLKGESHTEMHTSGSANTQAKHVGNPSDDKSNKDEKPGASHFHHTRRHHMTKERHRSLSNTQDGTKSMDEVKPKPKVPIPEISALADYARLKVIVSKDNEDNLQEQPPNKKEGFFPLIQSRHSKRPVFTVSQEEIVKEKHSANQPDASIKVSKEQKSVVFPITEKQHQRTGMFKLGDKETKGTKESNAGEQKMQVNPKEQTPQDKTNKKPPTETKIQNILEKSRATQAEEAKKAALREEEQRAREREAITAQIRERRKKLREPESNGVKEQIHPDLKVKDNKQEDQQKKPSPDEQRKTAAEEHLKKSALIEEQKRTSAANEQQRKMVLVEEQRRQAAHEEQLRKREDQQRRFTLDEQQRKAAQEEYKKKTALEEQQRRAALEEQQRKMLEEEQRRKAAIIEEQQKRRALEEKQRMAAAEEQQRKAAMIEEQKKAALKEEQRRAALEEQQRKKKLAEDEEQRKAAEEQKRQAALIEEKRRQAAHEEHLRKMAEVEQKRKAAIIEEQKKRSALEEEQRKAALKEEQRKAALEKQQRKMEEEEQQRKAAIEEQRKAAEEQERKAALIEEKRRQLAHEEQRRKTEEQKRQLALEEQRRTAQEEQKQKAALEEEQRKMAEEQHRKAMIIEEQKRKAALAEQQRMEALKEEQKIAALEEQLRKEALKEGQKRAALEEQQRKKKLAEEELRQKAAAEEQRKAVEEQRKAALIEEQKRQAAHEEQLRKKAEEEQQRKAAEIEEQKKRVLLDKQQRQFALEEQQRKAALEEQKQKAALAEQQRAAQKEQLRKMAEEEKKAAIIEEQKIREAHEEQQKEAAVIEERRRRAALEEEQQRRSEVEEQNRKAAIDEQKRREVLIENQQRARQEEDEKRLGLIREERIRRQIEEAREAQIEQERRRQQDQPKTQQGSSEVRPQNDKQETVEKENQVHNERQTHTAKETSQKEMDIRARQVENQNAAETEEQKNRSEKMEGLQYYSLTSEEVEKTSPPQMRNKTIGPEAAEDSYRPLAPVSPAPSLPRSSAASPAFGIKPLMFKVKDNTGRGSSLTKSIKPRFHKNFGEDFRVGSPMERVLRNDEDQDILRYNAGTPVYPEKSPSTPLPERRPFSRRSLALDEEDDRCHSVISNMSDMESFATNASDLADIRGLYDSDRPESACSFSSDVSRSMGRPPTVPPKSEKALRRAKRLTTRRIKKELTKGVPEDTYEASMSEAANASPHCAPPISIAHAPPAGSSVPSSHSHQHSFQATPHATAPVALPITSPHAKLIPQVPSSPTHPNAPKPVQYQVESGFPQPYTQKRVMQDVGSGQYYVVDVPVEVKTKTFFDPETGKYVQLNVRESNRNAAQRQPLQGYSQPHLKPKIHAKPQPNPPANPHYQGYHSYPKGYQSAATSSAPAYQSVTPETITQEKQPVRSSGTYQYGGRESQSYSPDKTPYMDTVNNTDKAHNVVYGTHGSQRASSEGEHQANSRKSRRGSRDIISMGELEDFMEVSDW